MDTLKNDAIINSGFPGAATDGYALTSNPTSYYNCIAWAASKTDNPWWPYKSKPWHWPEGTPYEETLDAFQKAFATLEYVACGLDDSLEGDFEKIAIYADASGKPTHAARQLASGDWTSKLGQYRDIHHTTVHALETTAQFNTAYGKVAVIMRRQRKPEHICLRVPGTPDK